MFRDTVTEKKPSPTFFFLEATDAVLVLEAFIFAREAKGRDCVPLLFFAFRFAGTSLLSSSRILKNKRRIFLPSFFV